MTKHSVWRTFKNMSSTTNNAAKVEVIIGCSCPPSRPWFNCGCLTEKLTYICAPINWMDLHEGCDHSPIPTVEAIAEIIREHPTARLIYTGGNNHITGKGRSGRHIDLARELTQ